MTNSQLLSVLRNINLEDCEYLENGIYYVKKQVKLRYPTGQYGEYKFSYSIEEFIVIAKNGIKQGIIQNFGNNDLHWYVIKQWRNQSVLSNVLRTGIISRIWPQITSVTCYVRSWEEDAMTKLQKTQYLASLAGLYVREGHSYSFSIN